MDVVRECRGRNLFFSTEVAESIKDADLIFISVGVTIYVKLKCLLDCFVCGTDNRQRRIMLRKRDHTTLIVLVVVPLPCHSYEHDYKMFLE